MKPQTLIRSLGIGIALQSTLALATPHPSEWSSLTSLEPAVGSYVLDEAPKQGCAAFAHFSIRPSRNSAAFEAREFWYQPDPGSEYQNGDHFREVNGEAYNIDPTWNVPTWGIWIKTKLKNGLLSTEGTPLTRLRGYRYNKSVRFSGNLQAEYRSGNTICHYTQVTDDELARQGEALMDAVIGEVQTAKETLLNLSRHDLLELCASLKDKTYCTGTGDEIQKRVEELFPILLSGLEQQKLGIRNPEQAYGGPVRGIQGRIYRESDGRAVFGGYHPFGLVQDKDPCTVAQSRKNCRLIHVLDAAWSFSP